MVTLRPTEIRARETFIQMQLVAVQQWKLVTCRSCELCPDAPQLPRYFVAVRAKKQQPGTAGHHSISNLLESVWHAL